MCFLRKFHQPRLRMGQRSVVSLIWLIALILVGSLILSGCQKPPTGDPAAAKALYGQRVGVVIRGTRYLFGEHGGQKMTYENRIATDSPDWVYTLALSSQDAIEAALGEHFVLVMLTDATTIAEDASELKFDGNLVMVTPTSPETIIPPDAALKQIMAEEELAGLIVLDQDWYLDTENYKTIACGVEISLLDSSGNVVFSSDPGLKMDGEEKFTNLLQDFVQELTLSLLGKPNLESIEDSLDVVNAEMSESIINRLDEFTTN